MMKIATKTTANGSIVEATRDHEGRYTVKVNEEVVAEADTQFLIELEFLRAYFSAERKEVRI